jgi:ribosomal protein S18 acetylase RimI-like enzyme
VAAGVEIRRARPEELDACADVYIEVLRSTFTWQPPERHQRADFFRGARDEEIYVALLDGHIVGMAGFYRPQDFLHSLYVTQRGRGIGKALLDHISATSSRPVSLKVQSPNLRAQAFYAREGFICVEEGRDPGSDVSWRRLVRERA